MQNFLLQKIFAKKVNKRPVDDMVSLIHDPKYGIIFTNGGEWKKQRKTFVSLLKSTGFQNERVMAVMDHIWPKLKKTLTAAPSMVVGVTEPMENSNCESLHKIDLAMAELMVLTFADKSLFAGGNVPQEYLENINTSKTCGVQWIEQTPWYRYPILKHLAPDYSGFTWVSEVVAKTKSNLNDIVMLHKKSKNRDDVSYIDAYLEEIDLRKKMGETGIDEKTLIASLDNFLLGGLDGIIAGKVIILLYLCQILLL